MKEIDFNGNPADAGNILSKFVSTMLEKKIKETRVKFFQGSVTIL